MRRDRSVVATSLVIVTGLAWLYLWRDAHAMAAMDMPGMQMPTMPHASGTMFLLTFVMWAVMMVGMMLPSAAPTVLLYAALVRKHGERGSVLPAVWVFTAGYLVVWTGFSLAAALAQSLAEASGLLDAMMSSANAHFSAALLIAAGVYQWAPIKEACLHKCRTPLEFFATRWRNGRGGALRMGVEHGMYCVGCCWVLMLLLFVAGVMNLLWVALLTVYVLAEKLLPRPRWTGAAASVAMIVAGVVLLVR